MCRLSLLYQSSLEGARDKSNGFDTFFVECCAIIEVMDNRVNDFTQGGVTYMKKKIPGYIGVCLLILAILAGCSETQPSEQPIVKETETANTITVAVDGSTFLPDATKSIKRDFSEGLTLKKHYSIADSLILRRMANGFNPWVKFLSILR